MNAHSINNMKYPRQHTLSAKDKWLWEGGMGWAQGSSSWFRRKCQFPRLSALISDSCYFFLVSILSSMYWSVFQSLGTKILHQPIPAEIKCLINVSFYQKVYFLCHIVQLNWSVIDLYSLRTLHWIVEIENQTDKTLWAKEKIIPRCTAIVKCISRCAG